MKRIGGMFAGAVPLALTLGTLALGMLVTGATPTLGAPQRTGEGFRLLIGDDVEIAPGESVGTVMVVDGDLTVGGDVDHVIVVNGIARIDDARIGDLVVINGQADLGRDAVVDGGVQLVQSVLLRDPEAIVRGDVRNDTSFAFGAGLGAVGVLFGIGYSLALLIAAALFAAVLPRVAREAGTAMTHEAAKTALGALALWVLLPMLAVLLVATVVGIPFAIGMLIFLLPTLAFIGYLVAGVRLGDAILSRFRTREPEDHPYGEALLGMLVLVLLSWIPGIGGVITFLAFLGGSGALALVGWRAMRAHEATPGDAAPSVGGVPSMN